MGHRMSGSSMGGQMGGNPYMSPAQPQQPAMQANPYMSGGAVGVNMQRQQSGPSAVNVNPYMQSQAPPQNVNAFGGRQVSGGNVNPYMQQGNVNPYQQQAANPYMGQAAASGGFGGG